MVPALSHEEKTTLLQLARQSLESAVQGGSLPAPDPQRSSPRLRRPGASFVTLTRHGALRGCIGALQASRALEEDVIEHAAAAGLEDFRFPPVQPNELADLRIEVSVLTDPQPLAYHTPDELLRSLRPNTDGVILMSGLHRATFLPQVWEKVPEAELFLDLLCEKAGLPQRAWRRGDLQVLTYQVESFDEGEAGGQA
ncbi:MAG: hypothetical protein A2Y93_13600 [Chloroflexi bacterium RBG_13_68_17]|nr:MAG: hypothetical protein A2Y93_13600 [Chloroflexi bacterium RBG_13_68_17]